MSTAVRTTADPGVIRARHVEDVTVGDEIVRHRLASRVIHWSAALFFALALFTGLPIWTPVFGWLAPLVGGLHVARWLHPWTGLLFFAAMLGMFFHWLAEMRLSPSEREWLRPANVIQYMKHETDDSQVGKYNGGQKLFFFAVALGALGLLVSGLLLWFPLAFPRAVREAGALLHDLTFVAFAVAIVLHVYLGTAAEPGTFRAMTRGTVTRAWARLHHGRWYRRVTSENKDHS